MQQKSHLLQMRGLKPPFGGTPFGYGESHLLQMRGLKLNNRRFDLECEVASFTDAWIETANSGAPAYITKVASFTDAWIETS